MKALSIVRKGIFLISSSSLNLIFVCPPEGVCPKGYVGVQCEHMVDVCPGGEHVCMNGAEVNRFWVQGKSLCFAAACVTHRSVFRPQTMQCVPEDSNGRLQYRCACDTIHTPFHKYAGDFCELKSTELCTFNGRPGAGKSKDAYCVNGGLCQGHVDEQQE